MIEYNLNKHKPKVVYDVNGIKKYLCKVRKMLIHITPEETVRQSFLSYLISEIKIPKSQILVEEPVLHHQDGIDKKHKGRVDILILDHENIPFIVYECKKESESFTDNVYDQAFEYYEAIPTIEYIGIVIGNLVNFIGHNFENEITKPIIYAKHPDYTNLCYGNGEVLIQEFENIEYERPNFSKPINNELIEELYDEGIIGTGTDEKLHPFLINFYGWLLDEKDTFRSNEMIQDIGVKFTKFGNAGGGNFTQNYRAFLMTDIESKPIVFIGLSSMISGVNSPIGTSLFVAIETNEHSHSSLQLRCDKYIEINDNIATIWHDATITIGKLGAAKRHELLDYISTKENKILIDNKILLGKIDFSKEMKSQQKETINLIENLIEYSMLRDEFRIIKKSIC